jgi:DNA-binding transcriptional regulator LsrR (DeoR family)
MHAMVEQAADESARTSGQGDAARAASEVARLFFDRQLTKVQIGALLGISRFRVARLIDQALDDGLVRIEYRDVTATDRELAAALETRFNLDLCIVAGSGSAGSVEPVARLAAAMLDELIGPGDVIGIAWGSTMAAVVREIPRRTDPSLAVVQLAGSSSRLDRRRDPGELARSLADRLGAAHHPLHAPAFVDSRVLRDALLAEEELAATIRAFERLTIAIVGVGALHATGAADSSVVRSGVLGEAELAGLRRLDAVGELVLHPFDATGRFVAADLTERAIAIPIERLRTVPRVIAVAAGAGKAAAIGGALASGVIRILVTDTAAASAILEDAAPSVARRRPVPRRAGRPKPVRQ